MIEIFTLRNDTVAKIPLAAARKSFAWIRCLDPTEKELEDVAAVTRIPFEELKEITDDEVPRVEQQRYLLVVYRTPFYEEEGIVATSLALFLKERCIVTIAHQKIRVTEELAGLFKKNKGKFLFKRPAGYFMYHILDKINDEFLNIIDRIADASDLLKQQVGEFNKKSIERIYDINNTLIHFNQALMGNMSVLHSLRKSYFRMFGAKDRENFSDLYYDTMQLIGTEKIQRGLITSLFNLQSVMNNYKLNQFMKRITSLALIIMIPTLVTGIYGMNFKMMPLADSAYGFYTLVAAMFLFLVIALYACRRLDWI